MRCQHCGKIVELGSEQCPFCGKTGFEFSTSDRLYRAVDDDEADAPKPVRRMHFGRPPADDGPLDAGPAQADAPMATDADDDWELDLSKLDGNGSEAKADPTPKTQKAKPAAPPKATSLKKQLKKTTQPKPEVEADTMNDDKAKPTRRYTAPNLDELARTEFDPTNAAKIKDKQDNLQNTRKALGDSPLDGGDSQKTSDELKRVLETVFARSATGGSSKPVAQPAKPAKPTTAPTPPPLAAPPEPTPQPEPIAQPEVKAQPKPVPVAEPEPIPVSQPEAALQAEPVIEPEPQAAAEQAIEPEPQPEPEAISVAMAASEPEPQPGAADDDGWSLGESRDADEQKPFIPPRPEIPETVSETQADDGWAFDEPPAAKHMPDEPEFDAPPQAKPVTRRPGYTAAEQQDLLDLPPQQDDDWEQDEDAIDSAELADDDPHDDDAIEPVMTEEVTELRVVVAGVWRRAVAAVFDRALTLALTAVMLSVAIVALGPQRIAVLDAGGPMYLVKLAIDHPSVLPAYLAVYLLIESLLVFGCTIATGQTPGQMLFDVRVIQSDGEPVSALRALVRQIGLLLSIAPFFLGLLWAAIDSQKQGIHDKLSGTYVIRARSLES